jgi:hypothetical protein
MPRLPRVSSASISELKALPDLAEQQNGLAKPPARGRNLLSVSAVLEVAVAGAGRGATAVGTAKRACSTAALVSVAAKPLIWMSGVTSAI